MNKRISTWNTSSSDTKKEKNKIYYREKNYKTKGEERLKKNSRGNPFP